MRNRQRRRATLARMIWIALGVLVVLGFGILTLQGTRPRAGEDMPVMASNDHIPEGSDPGEYSTNPPSSGPHYAQEMDAGFYETNNYPYPAGYLVHNLEHGYVIFWYNCALLDENGCEELKANLKAFIDEVNNFKVIAYPWDSINVPVVITSWGRLQEMETFDAGQARAFYDTNLNKAPEPNAP